MANVIAPPPEEQERWRQKQKEFIEKCREEDRANPPRDAMHKLGRAVWRLLTFPRDPRAY